MSSPWQYTDVLDVACSITSFGSSTELLSPAVWTTLLGGARIALDMDTSARFFGDWEHVANGFARPAASHAVHC